MTPPPGPPPNPSPALTRSAAISLAGCVALAGLLAAFRSGPAALTIPGVIGHAALFVIAAGVLLARSRVGRPLQAALAAATLLLGALVWLPAALGPFRLALLFAHLLAGACWVGITAAALLRGSRLWNGSARGWIAAPICLVLLIYFGRETFQESFRHAKYDPAAVFRFLTSTTAEQAGNPLFPSAVRLTGAVGDGCARPGCHAALAAASQQDAHAWAAASRAYRATYRDFLRRKGPEASRWCQGCHDPARLTPQAVADGSPTPTLPHSHTPTPGLPCAYCHRAHGPAGLFGSASMEVQGPVSPTAHPWEIRLRPESHTRENLRPGFHRSAEFCAGCHRKNWSLPQNGYHWMAGPDEYGQWLTSPWSGSALYAVGEPRPGFGCLGCHAIHSASRPSPGRILALDAFVRRQEGGVDRGEPLDVAAPLLPGKPAFLDVVVRNVGIGHDFPTGMPDQQESWLEVQMVDRKGRTVLRSEAPADGSLGASVHRYRLAALDRQGQPILHGDLDRMVSVGEWRRIPAGGADLARYRLTVPENGLAEVRVRMLTRRRPDFERWTGEAPEEPRILAELKMATQRRAKVWEYGSMGVWESHTPTTINHQPSPLHSGPPDHQTTRSPDTKQGGAERWRHYGLALAACRTYPAALQALNQALEIAPGDAETHLSLGRVYLDEGDLLAAREQFARARAGAGDRALAWEGAALRHMGQPEAAAGLLRPLSQRYPRDPRLHFELGRIYQDLLRNQEAVGEFERMLDLDPLDVSAHFNRMLCLQRLNQISEARREEAIYRLMREDESPPFPSSKVAWVEDRPLHVHVLEKAR